MATGRRHCAAYSVAHGVDDNTKDTLVDFDGSRWVMDLSLLITKPLNIVTTQAQFQEESTFSLAKSIVIKLSGCPRGKQLSANTA